MLFSGRPLAALHANAGGVMLAVAAVFTALWLLISAVLGRWVVQPPSEVLLLLFLLCWMLVILANWGLRFHDI